MKRNTPNSNGNVVPFTPPEPGDGDIKEEDRPGLEEIVAMLSRWTTSNMTATVTRKPQDGVSS